MYSNDLIQYFNNNSGRLITKWNHYFDIYERHFQRFRSKKVVILEIGVYQGGSLQMWKNYFGPNASVYGIDFNPKCKELEEENIKIFIGSQSDRKFLRSIKEQIPKLDILIDDGGHTMKQQIISFQELFDHIKDNGVYLCEDLHTSYKIKYGGGYKRKNTFIEYSKNFIDYLHAYHSEQKKLNINSLTNSVDSVHYYDSVIVIEKKSRTKPYRVKSGNITFQENYSEKSKLKNVVNFLFYKINKILRYFRLPGFTWK